MKWAALAAAAAVALLAGIPILVVVALAGTDAANATSSCLQQNVPAADVTVTAVQLSAAEQQNAADIIGVADAVAGERGAVIAVTAALTESGLNNDRPGVGGGGSVGLFQQIASDGWGTVSEEENPVDSAEMFLGVGNLARAKGLLDIPGWQQMQPWQAAQAVQQSGAGASTDGQANYGPAVAEAQTIVAASTQGPQVPAGICPTAPSAVPTNVAEAIAGSPALIQTVLAYALSKVGDPYQWGATGPDAFDCSGLVQAAYAAAGILLPRTTYQQVQEGQPITTETELEPGDLVFPFADESHVVIYLGAGLIVQAPQTGQLVQVIPFYGMAGGARRIVGQ